MALQNILLIATNYYGLVGEAPVERYCFHLAPIYVVQKEGTFCYLRLGKLRNESCMPINVHVHTFISMCTCIYVKGMFTYM